MLSPAFLDELRSRTALSALIGKSVKLTRAGREWKGCCPFHDEKTPSFYVNDAKAFYHCFGCSAHGDAIRWMTDHQGLPFMDAVKELAQAAGLDVPAPDPRSAERERAQASLHDIMRRAAEWFQQQLADDGGAAARAYLQSRRIPEGIAVAFQFGFAPPSRRGEPSKLRAALSEIDEERLIEVALLKRDDDGRVYDFFRNRLIIPIHDARGRVIGFGGRIIGSGEPKYLNSPDTALFDKGRSLFNLHRAASSARTGGRMVIVEGYLDVTAMWQAGVAEAVAPNGTALTPAQIALAWRTSDVPVCCFDGDSAGRKAAARAATTALPGLEPGRSLAFVFPPAGQDPDDVLQRGGSVAVRAMLERPQSLADILWAHECSRVDMASPDGRARLRAALTAHVETITHATVQAEYRSDFRRRFEAMEESADRRGSVRTDATSSTARRIGARGIGATVESAVLAGLLRYPALIDEHFEDLAMAKFADPALAKLCRSLVDLSMGSEMLGGDQVDIALESAGVRDLADQVRGAKHLPYSFLRRSDDAARADLVAAIRALPR